MLTLFRLATLARLCMQIINSVVVVYVVLTAVSIITKGQRPWKKKICDSLIWVKGLIQFKMCLAQYGWGNVMDCFDELQSLSSLRSNKGLYFFMVVIFHVKLLVSFCGFVERLLALFLVLNIELFLQLGLRFLREVEETARKIDYSIKSILSRFQ